MVDVARNHAANYFGEIAENPDFISLPIDELELLIQKTNLNVKNEEQVYNAVLKWFKGIGLQKSLSTVNQMTVIQSLQPIFRIPVGGKKSEFWSEIL